MKIKSITHAFSKHFSRRRFLQASAKVAGATAFTGGILPTYGAVANIAAIDLGTGLTLLQGAGCNVIVMSGRDGALVIDGGLAENSEALLEQVKESTGNSSVQTLINTHWHPEQTGSNEVIGRDGGVIIAHEKTRMYLSNRVSSATFEGHYGPLAAPGRPTQTTYDEGSLEFADQQINYGYLPAAHTDGDLYIHFPASNLLVAGGPVSAEQWPILDYRNGAWLGGLVRAHEELGELVNPETRIIPAHGRMLLGSDLLRHRAIYQELYLNLNEALNMGMGPEDVVAWNPLSNYQEELGDPAVFLNGAYRSMLIAYVPD